METTSETVPESSAQAAAPEGGGPEQIPKKRVRFERLSAGLGWLVWGLFGAWCVGQVFRDATHLTALAFYVPSLLVAVTLGVRVALVRCSLRQRVKSAFCVLLPVLVSLFVENHWDRRGVSTLGKETRRAVHWNIYGSNFGITNILDHVEPLNPDLMVFSEVPRKLGNERFLSRFREGFSLLRVGGMVVLARGELTRVECAALTQGTVGLVRWTDRGVVRSVMVADLPSSILVARDPLLRELTELMAELQPDLVLGDLNAPRLSRQLCRLPAGYRHAYDAVGSGWSATWPVRWPMHSIFRPALESILLAPMWSLDHCLIGPKVVPLRYDLKTLPYSDHRLQLFEFEN